MTGPVSDTFPCGAEGDRLALFVQHAPVAIAVFDREMRYRCWSGAWSDYYALGEADLSGRELGETVPDCPVPWQTAHRRAITGEVLSGREDRVRHPDGRTVFLDWKISPIPGDDGQPAGVMLFTEDVTGRVEAEGALTRAEGRMRLITSSLGIGVFELDFETGESFASDEFRALLGMGGGRVPDDIDDWLALLRPRDPAGFKRAWQAARDPAGSGQFAADAFPLVDGRERALQMRSRVIFRGTGPDARPERVVGILVDQTETRRLQEALSRAQDLETAGRLAGTVAHDFNNILTVIQSTLDLICIGDLDDRMKGLVDQARLATDIGAGLNKRLLSLAGGRHGPATPMIVDAHIAGTWEIFRQVLNDDISLAFDPGSDHAVVSIAAEDLDGALLNLVVNARDAQTDGGAVRIGTTRVVLSDADASAYEDGRSGDFVQITVSDDGAGMDADVKRRAKEPFFSTKDPGHGTGLGLTSVAMAAAHAGGFIDIRSGNGDGTEVSIFLPRESVEVSEVDADGDDIPFGDGELVLVVEDDALVREAVMQRLEAIGYAVIEAASAEVALELIDGGEPVDVVFSDVVMRGGASGIDLVRRVRDLYPNVAVLLTSGHVSSRFRTDDGQGFPAELLLKPYPMKRLARAVRRALDLAAARSGSRR
ncbi:PAS domain-containing protein [Rhodobacterales bacterium HKCCE3408]|nr:PAS domain-containing protein [Rhodobacterales bacterium HKCCE3408]